MPISKNSIKYVQSLRQKKFRQKYNNFVIEGDKIAIEVLQSSLPIKVVYALKDWLEEHKSLLNVLNCPVEEVSSIELKKISDLKTPNKVLLIAEMPSPEMEPSMVQNDLSLFLDGIQDPGNMGTILRIADWFGIAHVFCANGCVDVYNSKVVQSSMGAFLRVKAIPSSYEAIKADFPTLPSYATTLHGANVFTNELTSNGLIMIGNEGKGLSEALIHAANHRITIPSFSESGAESLNAGVATGIICAAFRGAK